MENKINIAELLKDCPKGMELDCTMYENVYFDKIYNEEDCLYPIGCYIIGDNNKNSVNFTKYGEFNTHSNAKCIIFPKGKTTWKGFVPPCNFKDGDIVATKTGNWIGITTTGGKNGEFMPTHCVIKSDGVFEAYFGKKRKWTFDRLATEEEKQKLFDAIKANGYIWNTETKTLKKLPIFKVGDRIKKKGSYISGIVTAIDTENFYKVEYNGGTVSFVNAEFQDEWELVPNKFDITTLKPFDKVLVRYNNDGQWCCAFFSHIDKDLHSHCYKFVTTSGSRSYCIPYEGNEHLLGTTDDCDEYYKTWE